MQTAHESSTHRVRSSLRLLFFTLPSTSSIILPAVIQQYSYDSIVANSFSVFARGSSQEAMKMRALSSSDASDDHTPRADMNSIAAGRRLYTVRGYDGIVSTTPAMDGGTTTAHPFFAPYSAALPNGKIPPDAGTGAPRADPMGGASPFPLPNENPFVPSGILASLTPVPPPPPPPPAAPPPPPPPPAAPLAPAPLSAVVPLKKRRGLCSAPGALPSSPPIGGGVAAARSLVLVAPPSPPSAFPLSLAAASSFCRSVMKRSTLRGAHS